MEKPIILIDPEALAKITADAARYAGRKERGGILIGQRRGPHLSVADATLPMMWDFGTMFSFRRSARGHQAAALKRWRESERTMDWVGEWHSHPERVPSPSGIDTNSWRRIVEDRGAPMAFIIVGYEAVWAGLCLPGLSAPIKYVETERSVAGVAFQRV